MLSQSNTLNFTNSTNSNTLNSANSNTVNSTIDYNNLKNLPKSYISGKYRNDKYGIIEISHKLLNSVDYIYVTFLKTNITFSGQLVNYSAVLKLDLSAIDNLPENYVSPDICNMVVDSILLKQKTFFKVSLIKNNSEINFEKIR